MSNQLQHQTRSAHVHSTFMFKHGTPASEIERAVWTEFRHGNRKALDYIFEKYVRLLYSYGGKISRDQGLVEDCIQDLFIELWNKRNTIGDTDNIKFYLFASLRRKIVRRLSADQKQLGDQLKDNVLDREVEFPIEFNIIQEQINNEREVMMKRALASLTERQREAIYLKFYEKLSYQQIAEVMDINLKPTYNIIGKAIDALRLAVHNIYHL